MKGWVSLNAQSSFACSVGRFCTVARLQAVFHAGDSHVCPRTSQDVDDDYLRCTW